MPVACLESEDILLAILYWLDGQSITRCSSVCRRWYQTIKYSTQLQYLVELWADGLEPGPARGYPVEELQALLRRRRAWATLDWSVRTNFPIIELPRAYELVGGVFAQHNTWPQSDFTAIRLPSAGRAATITAHENVGVESLDFAMDPTQDLVVFLHKTGETGIFNVRALSTLQPHPLAASPTLSFDLRDDQLLRIFLQVADDVVGLLCRTSQLSEGSLRLVLFNWRTGRALVDLAGPQLPRSLSDFALLSPRAYILASVNDAAYIPGMGEKGLGELHLFAFDGARGDEPDHVATLQLPRVRRERELERIVVHSGPFCARPIPGAPYSKSNEQRICVVSLSYDRGETYSVFVHHRYLARYLANRDVPPTIPWEDWGRQHARLLPGRRRLWLRYVHGERVVCPVDEAHPRRLEMLDFGIIPSRPGFDDVLPNSQLCVAPSTLSCADTVFQDDVTSSLPYRRSWRDLDQRHVLFLTDQDRIIGVKDAVDRLTVYAF
ncbi:hypothetical protein GGX14DRAFT_501344 [Mycena pura]|uniref:F-box domain-containing protein n=1 Tax=Mycena pura TaxID=153505 RepID=A0AAD6YBD5_9AGAR|nr:hypothetical protein GGX14DRAFT_501344 [Mycena pura]